MAHLKLIIRATRPRASGTRRALGFVPPMQCKHVMQLPSGESWFYEVKHDGRRVIAVKDGRDVDLFSDGGKALDYPAAREAVRQLNARRAVIDCGLISLHRDRERSDGFAPAADDLAIRLYAFDLLHLNGRDLTAEPIEFRKEKLCTLLLNSALLFSPSLNCEPEMLVTEVRRLSGVGVVAKRKGSVYEPGRCTESWITMDRVKFCAARVAAGKRVSEPKTSNFRRGMISTDSFSDS